MKTATHNKINIVPLPRSPHATGTSDKSGTVHVQRAATVTTDNMPSFGQNFEGIANTGGLPPDTNGAVGPNDYVQIVNFSFAIYNKQGGPLLGPTSIGTLWQGFGGACDPSADPFANGGDPVVLYDENANRWVITQLAIPQLDIGAGGFHLCIAVSQTSDPTGAWYRYDFLASQDTLNDYPKLAVWPDAYYESSNDFLIQGGQETFTGVTVTAYDRAAMLAGQQANEVSFTLGSQYGGLLPSNTEGGAIGENPPSGAPNPYFMSCDTANVGNCTSDQLDEWDFKVDWSNPANSTFGDNGAPTLTIPVAAFDSNLCDYNRDCIPQPGTAPAVDALSDRLLYQSAYRNLGSGGQAVVLNQTVNVSSDPATNPQAGVRWYELTNTGSGWSLKQQGTYAPDSNNRWMGSANIDASGDIALGYSVSSSTTFPSIRVAGRLAGDPGGQLSQGEETMMAGNGSQTTTLSRWGDYSAMQVDPTDGCTFWYTNEYYPFTSDHAWHTRVASFKFPSCTAGPKGEISGTVTDASTGKPIAGATVATNSASTTSDDQGHYDLVLPAGSYDLTFSAFGYTTKTDGGLQVTDGGTTTAGAALTPVASVHVTGTVTDGSGHGWPLHASIAITGRPGGPVWTDPVTGQYSVDLPQNATYALTVTTDLPGYQVITDSLTVGTDNLTHNISIPVDASACSAPGYHIAYGTPTLSETFDDYPGAGGTSPPPGWTITDNQGNGQVWRFDDPGNRGNLTGGTSHFAIVDSNFYGPGNSQDTALVTPALDLSDEATPVVKFRTDYFKGTFLRAAADVDLSTDGGQTWTNIWEHTSSLRGPDLEEIPIPQAGGKSDVQLRYHFTGTLGIWWQVDDVTVQNRFCGPVPGGLVVGKITDANTGNGLNGATVTSTDNTADTTVTSASADPSVGDGYYWLFSTLTGSHPFTAAKAPPAAMTQYQTATQSVTVAADAATQADFALNAGRLAVTPGSIQTTQVLGSTTNRTMTIKNTGTAPANVKLVQQGGSFQILTARGAPLRLVHASEDGGFSSDFLGNKPGNAGQAATAGAPADPTWSTIAPYPSATADNSADTIDGKVYSVGGVNNSGVTGHGYVYDPSSDSWSSIPSMPVVREKPGVAAVNGKLYVTGGWDTSGTPIARTDVYDPDTNTWSTVSPNPQPTATPGTAVANGKIYFVGGCQGACPPTTATVEVYDPASDTWTTAAPYPHPVSWESCGGIRGKVYCAGGIDSARTTYSDAYVYDPSSDSWSPIANMPIDLWGSAYGAANSLFLVSGGITNSSSVVTNQGYSYDPTTDSWTALPNAQFTIYRGGSSCGFYRIGGVSFGGTFSAESEVLPGLTECGTTTIPWLAENPTTATLQPGQSAAVTVTMSATTADKVTQPGAYTGQIGFDQDTPYTVAPVDVTMTVTPPTSWGKIAGTVSGTDCNGNTAPLQSAHVQADGKKPYSFSLLTGKDGRYAFWAPAAANPFTLIASADKWAAQTTRAIIKAGKTTTVNFTLLPVSC